jgi:hypothetical protein
VCDRINTIKEIDENKPGLSSDKSFILGDGRDFTPSPISLGDTQFDEKNDESGSVTRDQSTGRSQYDWKALVREVHHLLHSASLADIYQIASYLKAHEVPMVSGCTPSPQFIKSFLIML